MTTLKGILVGAGYFAKFHIDAWNRCRGGDIVAVCDLDPNKASEMASEFGIEDHGDDFAALLSKHRPDFVDIVTRPDTHLALVRQSMAAGCHVICQKPVSPTMAETEQIFDLAAQSDRRLMVHENFRFQPWYREMRRLIDDGQIGDRLHTITHRNRMGDGWGDDAYLARQPYFQTMPRFLIFEAGIHTIDTFRYLGGEIGRVWCMHRRLNPVIAGEDTAIGLFEFADGGVGVYDANRYNESTAKNPRYTFGTVTIEGSGGSIDLMDDAVIWIRPLGGQPRRHDYAASTHGFAGDCVLATQQHFIDALVGGTPFETDAPSYRRSLLVQEAMYRSAETGSWETPSS